MKKKKPPKSKRVGALRKDLVNSTTEEYGELYMTAGDLRTELRGKLRKIWSETTRRVFVQNMRYKDFDKNGREKYFVNCKQCYGKIGFSEKAHVKLASGKMSKKVKLCYQVDHVHGLPSFTEIERDIGPYIKALFYGEQRILCYACHAVVTDNQTKDRKKANNG